MDNDDFSESSEEKQPTSNGLREILEALRTIFVAAIALVISIGQWVSKKFTTWQIKSEEQSKILDRQRADEQEKIARALREEQKIIREEKRLADEKAKIAEEQRAEERAVREEERKTKERRFSPKKLLYPSLSAVSTFALIVGVTRLGPIAEWTRSQNECIQQNSLIDGEIGKTNLVNKVMRCNGGHD